MGMSEGYIKISDLLDFCDNQKDHSATPNDIMRMNHSYFTENYPCWISVKDRLPDKPGLYLCAVGASYHPVRVMEYRPVGMYENERYWVSVGAEINHYVYDWFVHAWMPLPEPPKED